MITVEDIQKYLEVSPTYAQKLIDDASGDEEKAYKTFIRKLNEKLKTCSYGGYVMGVIEGVKHKYILYASDGWEMCSVIPLNDDLYNLGNLAGMYYRNIFKGNVSKKN